MGRETITKSRSAASASILLSGSFAVLAITGLYLWHRGPAIQSGMPVDAFRYGIAGFFDGAAFGDAVRAEKGPIFIVALLLGMIAATILCFILGRSLGRFTSRIMPAADAASSARASSPGRLARIIAFCAPPLPPQKPGQKPFLVRHGHLIAAFVHFLPPPGPWWLRIVLAIVLGATSMPTRLYVFGATAGCALHVGALWLAHRTGIMLPASPDGWIGLLLLALPVILTVVVRTFRLIRG